MLKFFPKFYLKMIDSHYGLLGGVYQRLKLFYALFHIQTIEFS